MLAPIVGQGSQLVVESKAVHIVSHVYSLGSLGSPGSLATGACSTDDNTEQTSQIPSERLSSYCGLWCLRRTLAYSSESSLALVPFESEEVLFRILSVYC